MLLNLIKNRQSVRSYTQEPVARELIEKCIEAARLAPSACNSQPWYFVIVDSPELKNKLAEKIFTGAFSMNAFAKNAPVIIAVVSEKVPFLTKLGGMIRNTAYYLMDVAIATEHLVLEAEELGLGTCWIGWFNEKECKKILHIPRDRKIDCVITLGYSKDSPRNK
ncbi:MAG TPA: nitroreductase family protein, partial [Candidatus Omnitrophota bacterium]|nr:nitroreductase family protein [Candidatus Omnitrophota bacterium]